MKKIISILAAILFVSGVAIATETGIKIDKQVNGDYRERFIVNFVAEKDVSFFPKAYLNTAAVFVAPRADFTKANHECVEIIVGAKFQLPTNAILDMSTSGQYWWAGNSQGNPEVLRIGLNTASLTWTF
jgi:hypothetical protein